MFKRGFFYCNKKKITYPEASNRGNLFITVLEARKLNIKESIDLGHAKFLLCPHMVEGAKVSLESSRNKGTSAIMTYLPPKDHTFHTITLKI